MTIFFRDATDQPCGQHVHYPTWAEHKDGQALHSDLIVGLRRVQYRLFEGEIPWNQASVRI